MTAIKMLILGLVTGAFVFSFCCGYFNKSSVVIITPEQQWAREFIDLAHQSV